MVNWIHVAEICRYKLKINYQALLDRPQPSHYRALFAKLALRPGINLFQIIHLVSNAGKNPFVSLRPELTVRNEPSFFRLVMLIMPANPGLNTIITMLNVRLTGIIQESPAV